LTIEATQEPANTPGGFETTCRDLGVGLDRRFDGIDRSLSDLKLAVAETNQRLDRFERATERRFDRMDAQFEMLAALIRRDELADRPASTVDNKRRPR
jgi:hypothetical protein